MKAYEIIKQHDLKDCGACALLSIIRHYGGDMPLEKVRMDRKQELYKQAINLLKYIELAINNDDHYKIIRKQVLDLANNILRIDEE